MVPQELCLEGKVVLITGAAGNLGSHMARSMAQAGANLALSDFRLEPLEEVATEIRQLGRRSVALVADITDSQQVNKMIEDAIKEMGKIDVLINNAGIVRGEQSRPLWEISDKDWHLGIDTNMTGTFYCCRAIGQHMTERKSGKIINVGAGLGLRGARDNFMYVTAKGGVASFTRSLALTWAPHNIQVNLMVPGWIGREAFPPPPGTQRGRGTDPGGRFIPVGRVGTAQDVASLAIFLASDASDYTTGATYVTDGGGLAGGTHPTGYIPVFAPEEE